MNLLKLYIFVYTIVRLAPLQVKQVINPNELEFTTHVGEVKHLMTSYLQNSIDTSIVHRSDLDSNQQVQPCQAIQSGYQFVTQNITVIPEILRNDQSFDPTGRLNEHSLIALMQINDGFIMISSASVVFMFKYTYEGNFYFQKANQSDSGNLTFAQLIWKANMSSALPTYALDEIPLFVYGKNMNIGLIIYSEIAIFFSVTDMEQNNQQIQVSYVDDWRVRPIISWTIIFEEYIFNAVGPDGIDVYLISQEQYVQITFLKNFDSQTIFNSDQAQINDIHIQNDPSRQGILFIFTLDAFDGVSIFEFDKTSYTLTSYLRQLTTQFGGIALDCKGTTLIAAFQQYGIYTILEFKIQILEKQFEVIKTIRQASEISDVIIGNGLALIKGLNSHQIIHTGIRQEFLIESLKLPQYLSQVGLRDLVFFDKDLTYYKDKLQKIRDYIQTTEGFTSNPFYLDDLALGITDGEFFAFRYKEQPSYIQCFENSDIVGEKYLYSVFYNSTTCKLQNSFDLNIICRNQQDFSLEYVETLANTTSTGLIVGVVIGVLLGTLLLVFVVYRYWRTYKQKRTDLYEKIDAFEQKQNKDQPNNSSLKDNSSLQYIQAEKSEIQIQ